MEIGGKAWHMHKHLGLRVWSLGSPSSKNRQDVVPAGRSDRVVSPTFVLAALKLVVAEASRSNEVFSGGSTNRASCHCTIQLIVLLLLLLLDRCFRLQCGEPDEVHRQVREPTAPLRNPKARALRVEELILKLWVG